MHNTPDNEQRSTIRGVLVAVLVALIGIAALVRVSAPSDSHAAGSMSSATPTAHAATDEEIPLDQVASRLVALRPRYDAAGQSHVFAFVPELSVEQQRALYRDLAHIQVEKTRTDFETVLKQEEAALHATPAHITPFLNVTDLAATSAEQEAAWRTIGLDLIARGEVAAVLMAGGQGTRLGSSEPKGCYDIHLLSHKSLFQLQAERVARLRQIAADHAKLPVKQVHLRWYIMTSIVTHAATIAFFRRHSFFGLPEADVFFFQQSELPALDNSGKIILEQKHRVALAPNGNGGIFEGLQRQGAMDDMKKHGVKYIHVYGVDNVLAKVADPTFIGFAVDKRADCANKVVLKTEPSEKVGVMCLRDGRPSVVEYSELPAAMSVLRSESTGQLVYSAGNIVQHFFTFDFLQQQATVPLIYHVARKAIPYVDPTGALVQPKQPSGLKLEMFVFDAFERASNMQCMAVLREPEFSPVKNAAAAGVVDSPATARQALSDYHCRLLTKAGAKIVPAPIHAAQASEPVCTCEISPLVSYSGEGLDQLVNGKTITLPFHLDTEATKKL